MLFENIVIFKSLVDNYNCICLTYFSLIEEESDLKDDISIYG